MNSKNTFLTGKKAHCFDAFVVSRGFEVSRGCLIQTLKNE